MKERPGFVLFCFQRTEKYRCCGDDGNTAHRIPICVHGEQVKGIVEDEHESQDESRPERQQSKRQAEPPPYRPSPTSGSRLLANCTLI